MCLHENRKYYYLLIICIALTAGFEKNHISYYNGFAKCQVDKYAYIGKDATAETKYIPPYAKWNNRVFVL